MQRKFTKSLLATAILFGLTACGSSGGGGGSSEPTTKANTAVNTATKNTATTNATTADSTKTLTQTPSSSKANTETAKNNTNTATETPKKEETITVPTVIDSLNSSSKTGTNQNITNDIKNEITSTSFKLDSNGNPSGKAIYSSADGSLVLNADFDNRTISGYQKGLFVQYQWNGEERHIFQSEYEYQPTRYENQTAYPINIELQETNLYKGTYYAQRTGYFDQYTFSGKSSAKTDHPNAEYQEWSGTYSGMLDGRNYGSGSYSQGKIESNNLYSTIGQNNLGTARDLIYRQ